MSNQKKNNEKNIIGMEVRRTFDIEVRANEDDRSIDLSFSSETPVERWGWVETLDHSPGACDLSRLNNKAAFLLDHDRAIQVGVIEKAEIGKDKRGHARARFGKSQKADEIYNDVQDGIRSLVSVGYKILEVKLEKSEKDLDYYRVTKWQPMEISIVSIPADDTVGIGREDIKNFTKPTVNERKVINVSENVITQADLDAKQREIDNAKTEADLNNARILEITRVGEQFNMVTEAIQAIREGVTLDEFKNQAMAKLNERGHIDSNAGDLGMDPKEIKTYSILRALQAQLTGDWSKAGLERDAHMEAVKKNDLTPRGVVIPHDVLKSKLFSREITTASGGTGLVKTEHMAENFIEMLRNKAVLAQLGANMLTGLNGSVSIPKQTGAATAYWVAEGGDGTASDSAYGAVTLGLKTITAQTLFSRALLLQSDPSIEFLVTNDLTNVLALGIDAAGIQGTGSSNQPTGITNTSGVGSVTGASIGWAGIVEFESDVAAANADIGSMAYLSTPAVRGHLKTTVKESGYPVYLCENNEVNGYPLVVSGGVPSATMIFGVFSQVLIGLWGGLDILVDPFADAAAGGVYLRAFQSADIAVRHAAAFSVASSIS